MNKIIFSIILLSSTNSLLPLSAQHAKKVGLATAAMFAANVGGIITKNAIKQFLVPAGTEDKKAFLWCAGRFAMGTSTLACSAYVLWNEFKAEREYLLQTYVKRTHNTNNLSDSNAVSTK